MPDDNPVIDMASLFETVKIKMSAQERREFSSIIQLYRKFVTAGATPSEAAYIIAAFVAGNSMGGGNA